MPTLTYSTNRDLSVEERHRLAGELTRLTALHSLQISCLMQKYRTSPVSLPTRSRPYGNITDPEFARNLQAGRLWARLDSFSTEVVAPPQTMTSTRS